MVSFDIAINKKKYRISLLSAHEALVVHSANAKSLELQGIQMGALRDVSGMDLYSILSEEYTERIKSTSGVKKLYFNIKKKISDKNVDKYMLRIETMLKGHEFEKRTILPFLNMYQEKGKIIPKQLQEIIGQECSEIDTSDEIAWEKSLVDYLKK